MWLVREQEREQYLREQHLQEHKSQGIPTDEEDQNEEKLYKISIWARIYYSRIFRAIVILLAVAVLAPVFLMLFLDDTNPEFDGKHSCSQAVGYQVLCGVQNTTFEDCSALKCCFNATDNSCFHKAPSYYNYVEDKHEPYLYQPMIPDTPFGEPILPVYLNIKKESNTQVLISLSTEKQEKDVGSFDEADYTVDVYESMMGLNVSRRNGDMILKTTRASAIVSDRYWEWSADLIGEHLFGMDFLRIPDNETITRVVYKNSEDHTSVPRFMSCTDEGTCHGLEVVAEGPLEVTVTQSRLVVLRMLSGNILQLRLFTGPSPRHVYHQFQRQGTWRPPPKWVLGVHVCRDGDFADIDEVLLELENFQKKRLFPYDSDCIHENIFSLSQHVGHPKLNEAVQNIKKNKKFLMSLSPQILSTGRNFESAKQLNILYKWKKEILVGTYLNESVTYPDYGSPKAAKWFKDIYDAELAQFSPDGLILRNNWPVNQRYALENNTEFQYMTEPLRTGMSRTLPWDSVSSSALHIDVHNTYGLEYANVVATQTQSAFILTGAFVQGSPFPAHVQNTNASWANFKHMLHKSLSHSLLAGQLVSVPVCGDTEYFSDINQGVCIRWYLAASTMPLFRISSDLPRRDPTEYNDIKYIRNIMEDAIKKRYALLPYYYTVLSQNLPMVRPMFFDFSNDNETFRLDEQYMIGDALLMAHPVLFPTPYMQVYLPEVEGGWYEFWGGMNFNEFGWLQLHTVESDLIVYVAAGSIIPMKDETGSSVEETEEKPLKLVMACRDKAACSAKGTLYAKNSITVEFQATENSLLLLSNVEVCQTGNAPDFSISKLKIYEENKVQVLKVPDDQQMFCLKNGGEVTINYSGFTPIFK